MNRLFFAILFLSTIVSCTGKQNCQQYKTGEFFAYSSDDRIPPIYIRRNDTLQVEKMDGMDTMYSRIKWVNDCTYNVYSSDKDDNRYYSVHITTTNEQGYNYAIEPVDYDYKPSSGSAVLVK